MPDNTQSTVPAHARRAAPANRNGHPYFLDLGLDLRAAHRLNEAFNELHEVLQGLPEADRRLLRRTPAGRQALAAVNAYADATQDGEGAPLQSL